MEAWNGRFHIQLRDQTDHSTISISVANAVYTIGGPHLPPHQCDSKEALLQSPTVLSLLEDRDTALDLMGSAQGVNFHNKTYIGTTYAPNAFEASLVRTAGTEQTPLLSRITCILEAVRDNQPTLDRFSRLSLLSENGARIDMAKPGFMQTGMQLVLVDRRGRTAVDWATAIRSLQSPDPSVITLCVTTLFDRYEISFQAPAFACNPLFNLVFT